ncbi:MAG: homoserine kinase [Tissierellia bacterium]|jgi:homoserine kinase|nr:homoserine kinase [Tissierellia bacterium]
MIKVKTPATTANIGPGFDVLGLAFKLYNEYTFEEIDKGLVIEGCPDVYNNKENLVYKSFLLAAEQLGKKVDGLKISMKINIPVSRGLGSSSACIVGGVYGANAFYKGGLTKEEMYKIAVMIEGHPDNISPCVYGGLTASMIENEKPYTVGYDISSQLKFCALIPDFETSTNEARKILPKTIDFKDAVFNVSRVAVLLKALETGDMDMINIALKDKLHQSYRGSLIHEWDDVKTICEKGDSLAFFISGSGPTLMNITKDENFPERIKEGISRLKHNWEIKMLETDKGGAKAEIL